MSSNECAGLQTQYDVFSLDKAETLALLHGCGFSYEELKKPRVAVFNTLNPMNPGHIHQGAIAKAVAEGVREAGGLPVEFNGTNLCDSMLENQKYTLPSRDLLVNDIDLMVSSFPVRTAPLCKHCVFCLILSCFACLNFITLTGNPFIWYC